MGGGPQPQVLEQLDPAEALYFWLRGFTNDPQNPLFGPLGTNPDLVERTPIFEFDKTRLLDKDQDGWLEYYPRFAQERPLCLLRALQLPIQLCQAAARI